MFKIIQLVLTCLSLLMACAVSAQEPDLEQIRQQVEDTERALSHSGSMNEVNCIMTHSHQVHMVRHILML